MVADLSEGTPPTPRGHLIAGKAAQLLGYRQRRIPVGSDGRADVAATAEAIGRRTIVVVGSAPSYAHGVVDPIEEIGALAQEHGLLLHVDACIGGWLLPYFEWLGASYGLLDDPLASLEPINRFFRPLVGGIQLDPTLGTSRRIQEVFELVRRAARRAVVLEPFGEADEDGGGHRDRRGDGGERHRIADEAEITVGQEVLTGPDPHLEEQPAESQEESRVLRGGLLPAVST